MKKSKMGGYVRSDSKSSDLHERVSQTLKNHHLLTPRSTVVVGFSGGIDSVCLLHVLTQLSEYELKIWALYVNHELRPSENKQEIALLERVGREWGIGIREIKIDIPTKLQQQKKSLQLIAREERYKAFEAFRNEVQADRIALAHHQDDQAETVLYRIIRGTGLDGLAGMPVSRGQVYIRPLLEVSRAAIRDYVFAHQLEWVEDSSNQKLLYQRNRIRHQLLPELEKEYNPRVKAGLLRLALLAREQTDYLETLTAELCRDLLCTADHEVKLKLTPFLALHPYIQYQLLKKALGQVRPFYQIELDPLTKIRDRLNRENNKFKPVYIYKGIRVHVKEEWIVFCSSSEGSVPAKLNVELQTPGVTEIDALKLRIEIATVQTVPDWKTVSSAEIYLDADGILAPLRLRFWTAGDRFRPLGAPGQQKIHDFYINSKIPHEKRGAIPLLVNGDNQIIWVMGYRVSENFKITSLTRRIWRIRFFETG